ncbi:competence protein CoiA [Salipaludibacillus keqinensis]|nr:competence protein CoiA family protein [Salipaludibacillus keqinensis]
MKPTIEHTFPFRYDRRKEVMIVYRADRSDGETISLYDLKACKDELDDMRKHYQFFCPACSDKVILKLGNRQAWHFAHQPDSPCVWAKTGETLEHGEGKQAIFNWLKSFQLKPKIEQYLPELKRRPDIFVRLNDQPVVIEIQRSHIQPELFYKRHFTYVDAGYVPVWIGLQPSCEHWKLSIKSLSQLDSFLIRPTPVPHAIYFVPKASHWVLYSRFHYLQPRKTLLQITHPPLMTSPQTLLLNPSSLLIQDEKLKKEQLTSLFKHWKKQTITKRSKLFLNLTVTERKLLPLVQRYQINLNYFPAICHLPLRNLYLIDTPPQLWQTWVVIAIINDTPLNEKLNLSSITETFHHYSHYFHFTLRPSTEHPKKIIRTLLEEYFQLLCFFNVLVRVFPGVYKVIHHVTLNKTLTTLYNDDLYVMDKLIKYLDMQNK